MKLAANISLLFRDLPLLQRITQARQLGFSGVEVQFPYELAVSDWQSALQAADMPLVLINLPAGDFMQGGDGLACHPQRKHAFRQALEQALPYLDTLQPEVFNILAGRQPLEYETQACLDCLLDNLQFACERLADYPLRITCEPINNLDQPRYLTPRVADWTRLAEALQQPAFGLQLDIYHAARMQEDLTALIKEYAAQLAHIQFADSPGRSHPGTGNLNLDDLFQQLAEVGYSHWLAAEFPADSHEDFTWLSHIHGIL
ncbi:hydroxypyruvate isomerase family protein [Marinospirillum alkaliphilum]|uniref:Hydroxypyruvate isomerase n=1 Tax=Marinospirillum alkaliphilum DSM 21637 TaxID=1122209 RepID=A0A1K1XK74_9GAMM|nr:TIM barrel protein [Marinospirillum alkaliphilum]SFX50089.1 hydroxypyruvate isomerase [Marinospirillum alkaliphilum DSM 21637]